MNPMQENGCSRPGLASNEGARVRRAVRRGRILALASVLAAVPVVTGIPQVSAQAKPHPVVSLRHEVSFVGSSVASLRAAKGGSSSVPSPSRAPDPISTARAGAVTPVQDVTRAVTVVGVTWPKGAVSVKDEFQIRTLTAATWSQWRSLDVDEAVGPDSSEAAGTTAGTSPYVVTGASKFEVRSLTTNPTVPTAAKVQVIDPGESTSDSVQPAPGAAAAAAAKPTVYPRAAWGADESKRRGIPSYGRVQVGFVHHTDSPNSYSPSEVPAMIRGIYAYHIQSQGWDDIGYNFIVDRFGRTWEGRFGGMDRAVIGAQTMNYNSVSMGVSALGNFETATVPSAVTNAFKRIFAWKFSLSGIPATGGVVANGKLFPRVAGHRDGFQTACPGKYMYAKLPEMRSGVAALMGGLAPAPAPAPAPIPAPPPAPAPTPRAATVTRYTAYKQVVLRKGHKGPAVTFLQRRLRVSSPNGIFGASTQAVVMAFQTRSRLPASGIVSLRTWNRLELRDHPLVGYRSVILRQDSRGAAVVAVQRRLGLTADGDFGPITAAAVMVVQGRANLARTGVVSGWTWVAIERWVRR